MIDRIEAQSIQTCNKPPKTEFTDCVNYLHYLYLCIIFYVFYNLLPEKRGHILHACIPDEQRAAEMSLASLAQHGLPLTPPHQPCPGPALLRRVVNVVRNAEKTTTATERKPGVSGRN